MSAGINVVAGTIVRFSMKSHISSGRNVMNNVDVSLDEFGTTRNDAVQTLVPGVIEAWQDNILPLGQDAWIFDGAHYTDLDSLGGVSGDHGPIAGHPLTGTGSNATTPSNVALLTHLNCAHTRKQKGGRLYTPCLEEGKVDGVGNVDETRRVFFEGKVEAFRQALLNLSTVLSIATVAWRVVHIDKHRASGESPTDPSVWTWSSSDVDSVHVDTKVATQRRRLRG